MRPDSSMAPAGRATAAAAAVAIPRYLEDVYWWAYVHPRAVRLFERPWLVNLILWGNFGRLRDAALAELGTSLPGLTLQVACVYGDLTSRLCACMTDGGVLDVVDVLEVQLRNLRRKLPGTAPVSLILRDSAALGFEDAKYDRALLFFLLHEQPESVRRRTLAEALRVVKPGGKVVVIDYHKPRWWNPCAHLYRPLLRRLEPFALDLWRREIAEWLPDSVRPAALDKTTYFGGLYQKLVITR